MSMLTTEWNWDTAKKVWQDEAREEGLSRGREEGRVEREEIFKLFEQGLSIDEVKERLKN
jgi:predicted transposase YdaD